MNIQVGCIINNLLKICQEGEKNELSLKQSSSQPLLVFTQSYVPAQALTKRLLDLHQLNQLQWVSLCQGPSTTLYKVIYNNS